MLGLVAILILLGSGIIKIAISGIQLIHLISFLLNNTEVRSTIAASVTLLEFIRYRQHLKGTKTGCNEGDCGACTVLVGDMVQDKLRYRSFTSCLTPLGNVHGKHVVTIEGINMDDLNPIQQCLHDESATQCGFCTPGFVMSMAGFCLSGQEASFESARAAVDGNICRCTGYKSIERAATRLAKIMESRKDESPEIYVSDKQILPAYFKDIPARIRMLQSSLNGEPQQPAGDEWLVGGGTDLYVQKHDELREAAIHPVFDQPAMNGIYQKGNTCEIGAAATVTDLLESPLMLHAFPRLAQYLKLVSSTPIRNMATIAGNFINASPIGDFTIFFLALNARLLLSNGESERELPLRHLYKGYKQLNKSPAEFVKQIRFELPQVGSYFNFEKVSKRTNLDIASVNTAFYATMADGVCKNAAISAGGVGPVPTYLEKGSAFLVGKNIDSESVHELLTIVQQEISPISDARGSEAYKRLLLSQLVKAHFVECFPGKDWWHSALTGN